jgi:hypothetical protein
VTVGIPHSQHQAVYEAVNRLQTLTHRPASAEQVHQVIGNYSLLRPIRQNGVPWRTLITSDARMATLWTLAVAGSTWGVEFADSFLEFCTAVLVGPVCAVSREECKEAFAAFVAVATIARARPIAHEELGHCQKVWWMVDIIEKVPRSQASEQLQLPATSGRHLSISTPRQTHSTSLAESVDILRMPIRTAPLAYAAMGGFCLQRGSKISDEGWRYASCADPQ